MTKKKNNEIDVCREYPAEVRTALAQSADSFNLSGKKKSPKEERTKLR